MYKDVWKRFGAKILIVACSILLLGGVAIAAPRLRAVTDNLAITVNSGNTLTYINDETAVIPKNITIAGKVVIIPDGEPVVNGKTAEWSTAGMKFTCLDESGTDWTQAGEHRVKIEIDSTNTSYGWSSEILGSSGVMVYTIEPQTARDIQITTNNASTYPSNEIVEGDIAVKSMPHLLIQDNFTVKINGNETKKYEIVTKKATGGSSSDENVSLSGGPHEVWIKLKNYKDKTQGPYVSKTVTIKKHIYDFQVTMGGVVNGAFLNDASFSGKPTVVVKDGERTLVEDTDYTVQEMPDGNKFYLVVTGIRTDYSCVGTMASELYEHSTASVNFYLAEENATSSSIQKRVPYDETKNTYQISEMDSFKCSILMKEGDSAEQNVVDTGKGDVLSGSASRISWHGDAKFIKDSKEDKGATAGVLRQTITVTLTDGTTKTGTLEYRVTRNLADDQGRLNSKLRFDAPIPAPGSNDSQTPDGNIYKYDGNEHKMIPQMYFEPRTGEEKRILTPDEYTLGYELDPMVDNAWANVDDPNGKALAGTDKGTVLMKITGREGLYPGAIQNDRKNHSDAQYDSGWEMLENAKYEIDSQEINADLGDSIALFARRTDPQETKEYLLGTTKDTIIGNSYLRRQDGTKTLINTNNNKMFGCDKSKDIVFYYLGEDTTGTGDRVTEDVLDMPGTYRVEYRFHGNYETKRGSISCLFTIQAIDGNYTFETLPCEENDNGLCYAENTGDTVRHIYNGEPHKPKVQMYDNDGKPISSNGGKVYSVDHWSYSDDTNSGKQGLTDAGNAIAYVHIAGMKADEFIKVPFTIEKRTLESKNITFLEKPDNFSKPDNKGKQTYKFDNTIPTLTGLSIEYPCGSSSKKVAFTAGEDFTVVGLYDKNKVRVASADDIVEGEDYYYRIRLDNANYNAGLEGNNDITDLFTNAFQFKARDIKETTLPEDVGAVEYDEDHINSKVETFLKTEGNYVLTDFTESDATKKTLEYDKDYTIAEDDTTGELKIEDKTDENGTVIVTLQGIGAYSGTREITLNVGVPITRAEVNERGANSGPHTSHIFSDKLLTLDGTYGYDAGANQYGIAFDNIVRGEKADAPRTMTFLWDAAAKSGEKYLALDLKYRVDLTLPSGYPQPEGDDAVYYALEITGINGYYGKATIRFKAQKRYLNKVKNPNISIEVIDDHCIFKRTNVDVEKPIFIVKDGEKVLTENTDYEIIYTSNLWQANPNAQVKIQGKGAYTDSQNETFTIHPCPLGQIPLPSDNANITSGSAFTGGGIEISFLDSDTDSYSYIPNHTAVIPRVKVTYNYGDGAYELTENTDYTLEIINNTNVNDPKEPYAKQPMVIIRSVGSNFTGGFVKQFQITPFNLEDETKCEIKLENEYKPFTGKLITDLRPTATVKGSNPFQINEKELVVTYQNNYHVSKLNQAIVLIEGESPNYIGRVTKYFTIRGELNRNDELVEGGDGISKTVITGGVIPYKSLNGSPEVGLDVSAFMVQYSYKPPKSEWIGNGIQQQDPTWTLDWRKDYNIYIGDRLITDMKPTIGIYPNGHITGVGCFVDNKYTSIVVQGDLSNRGAGADTQVTLSGHTELLGEEEAVVITTTNGAPRTAEDLAKAITVTCGGRTLVYGKDYRFAVTNGTDLSNPETLTDLDLTLGQKKTVYIIPAKATGEDGNVTTQDVRYLTGWCPIQYTVKEDLTLRPEDVKGVESEYQYNHGNDVINLDNVEVTIVRDGKQIILSRDSGCEITFGENGGKTVGNHEVIIQPSGNYSGDPLSIPFKINKYDLGAAYNSGNVKITWDKTATYTGENVFPRIQSVRADTVSGTAVGVNLYAVGNTEGAEGAYVLQAKQGENNDNINFSNGKLVKCILAGDGNYTGEVELEYSILQKNITDQTDGKWDVKFRVDRVDDKVVEYEYQNGQPIKPEPEGVYNGVTFTGKEDTGGGIGSVAGTGVPFIFTYPEDTINVGTKTIKISGTGNFTGDRTLDYKIIPLNFANTDLEFAPGEIVYDGTEQHPAFKLHYGGKEILSYDQSSGVVSSYIPKVEVKFQNAVNATKEKELAKVIIEFPEGSTDANYTGRKVGEFAIQQASLQDHVKFKHHPAGEGGIAEINSPLKLDFLGVGKTVKPNFASGVKPTPPEGEESDPGPFRDTDLQETEVGAFYDYLGKANDGSFLKPGSDGATVGNGDYMVKYKYVEPDSEDTDVKEGYGDKDFSFAGKVKVTITGINNYKDSACFWYFIGKDISEDGSARLQTNTAIYNAQKQPPTVVVSGIDGSQYNIARYKGEVKNENYFTEKDRRGFIDAATYYIRLEGKPTAGTYATKPITLTYTIQPRQISNSVVIDGFKKEYNYTGLAICPVGISVTDYIDRTKYKLTENEDYSLTYTNNINVGTATINVNGEGNFKGTAAARFAITSSMISGGSNGNPGGSVSNGSGQISGAVAVAPDDVRVTLDAGNAMYYTGKQLTPAVTISGMTQNTDYTVTYSNNIEVGTGVITITGMGNNTGTITKNFRIVAKLSDCKVTNIPDQQYTGSAVEPLITVTCGNSILTKDKDYTVSFVNNVEIGTATAMIRAAGNSNYIGSLEAKFNIGNNVGGFIVSGYAPTYPYTGSAITPAVTVESGSTRLQQGTDYTVSYENNVDAGSASIIVKGAGKYTGTQTVNFIIEPRSIQVCDTTEVEDKTYTGDAYTPSITVRDSGKVLQNGVDYTLTYSDNVNPGLATITIQGLSNNYTGTKKITFRIGGVAVSGLQVSAINATSIKLRWQQQGYADGYQVCNSKSKVVKTVNGGNDSTTVTGLKPGKTYKYKVRSYTTNSQGERSYSAASAVVTATTKLKTPAVTLKRKGTGRMRIKWTKSTNADGYEIFYKNTKSAKYRRIKKVDDVNTRICNVRGIKSGKKCYVRVRAYKKTGSTTLRSAMSKTKTIKVK